MSDDRVRDLVKGLGDAVVPVAEEREVAAARARAIPRIEASLRAVAASNARRSRTRRVALAIGIAAVLAIGVASAAMLTRASKVAPPGDDVAPAPVAVAPSKVEAPSPPPVEAEDPNVGDAKDAPRSEAETPAPPRPAPPRASASSDVSTLSEQNRLLAAALDARRRNDDAKAIVFLNELLRKYPSSPLAEDARVERLRCVERLGQRGANKP